MGSVDGMTMDSPAMSSQINWWATPKSWLRKDSKIDTLNRKILWKGFQVESLRNSSCNLKEHNLTFLLKISTNRRKRYR